MIAAERLRDKVEGVAPVIRQHGDRIVRGIQTQDEFALETASLDTSVRLGYLR